MLNCVGDFSSLFQIVGGLCTNFANFAQLGLSNITRGEQPETGDVVNAVVQTVIRSFALVEFTHNGESYLGQIHISEFTKLGYGYIRNLSEIVHIDDEYRTALLDYHEKYERWNLQIIPQELE